jgi:hypothetical protein
MILPLGIFIALVWFLVWLVVGYAEDEKWMFPVMLFGTIAIGIATALIHHNWPVAQTLAEAVK